jgi:hypothetical protein
MIFIPNAVAKPDTVKIDPHLTNVVATALQTPQQPTFPDLTANYNKMVADKALQAQQALDAQNAIKRSYTAPTQSTDASNPMLQIFMRESGNNPAAINASSGACGLGQALPCSKMPCSLSDYNCQVNFFTSYAISRYGSWDNAWLFWQQHNWW